MDNVAADFFTRLPERVWAVGMRDAIREVNTDLVKSPKRLRALWLALEALNRPLKTETRKFEALKMELVTLMLEAAEWILKTDLPTYSPMKRAKTAPVAELCARELLIVIEGGGAGDIAKAIEAFVVMGSLVRAA
ncbi:hypothetical protein LTR37_001595 [Vermiconidia calcicola]|uniref:Uncharacterized protein n=1 Tax=Vermiconidia calcicola TaxID=1690605 RepID=A0ACC3NV73_9PEZI|nr:hypothetical protein LTR37_001595 [Vermiconidia calcicola]